MSDINWGLVSGLGNNLGGAIGSLADIAGVTPAARNQVTLGQMAKGGASYDDMAKTMLANGDMAGARTLADLGLARSQFDLSKSNTENDNRRQDNQFAFQQSQAGIQNQRQADQFGFQQSQAGLENQHWQKSFDQNAALAAAKPPQMEKLYDTQGNEQPAAWVAGKGFVPVGNPKATTQGFSVTTNPDGTTTVTQGGKAANVNPYSSGGKFTDGEGKAAGFADRMLEAESVLKDQASQGMSKSDRGFEYLPGGIGNYLQSEGFQQFKQARDNFINSQLRRESGAAIAPSEYENADRQYFPQPGDSPKVIAQKAINRRTAISAMAREGGASYAPKSTFDQSGNMVPYQPPQQINPAQQGRQVQAPPQAASPAPYPDGTQLQGADGKTYRVQNGVPVLEQQ